MAADEMNGKIKAVVDSRSNPELLVMARTDAAAPRGFEAAIELAHRYAEAGADIHFVEAVTTAEELRALPARLLRPALVDMVIGGRTPITDVGELQEGGFGVVLYANAARRGATVGFQRALTTLRDCGTLVQDSSMVVSSAERQRLVRKSEFDELAVRYSDIA